MNHLRALPSPLWSEWTRGDGCDEIARPSHCRKRGGVEPGRGHASVEGRGICWLQGAYTEGAYILEGDKLLQMGDAFCGGERHRVWQGVMDGASTFGVKGAYIWRIAGRAMHLRRGEAYIRAGGRSRLGGCTRSTHPSRHGKVEEGACIYGGERHTVEHGVIDGGSTVGAGETCNRGME